MKWLQLIFNTNQYLQIGPGYMMEACGHPKKKPVGHIHYSYEDGIDFCH